MALKDRLADNTVEALVALVHDLNERFTQGAKVIYGDALYGSGDSLTVADEVRILAEATAHIAVNVPLGAKLYYE